MTRVQADPALKDALTRNGERVEIVDDSGRLIGIAYNLADISAREGDPYDREEVQAALSDPRRYTTDEFLKKLSLE